MLPLRAATCPFCGTARSVGGTANAKEAIHTNERDARARSVSTTAAAAYLKSRLCALDHVSLDPQFGICNHRHLVF